MANQYYNNEVLENQYNTVLATLLDMNQFVTLDDSLEAEAGNIKTIITKSVTGNVEDLALGVGNTATVEVTSNAHQYPVVTTQGRFVYYDEEAAADPFVVESGIKGLGEKMVNDFVAKAVAEWGKTNIQQAYNSAISFNDFCDALGKLNSEQEDKFFCLVAPTMVAALRKALKDDLKYSEDFVRTGYIGSVVGVPLYISKGLHDGEAIIAAKEAVRVFLKKDTEIEQERDGNLRKNTIYARKASLVALVDATKVCKIAKTPTTTATITTYTKNQKTVAGAATTGATVEVFINGVLDGTATAASSAYSYTAKANLSANDVVKVVAHLAGEVDSIAEVTVAA